MENFRTLPTSILYNPKEYLQISKAELLQKEFSLAIDLLNKSDKYIKKVSFGVKFKNIKNEYIQNASEFFFTSTISLVPKSSYYVEPFSLDERFFDARSIEVRIVEFETDSGKVVLNKDQEELYTLAVIPEKKQRKIERTLSPEIKTYGENYGKSWRCVCGSINDKNEEECLFCKRNKNFVLSNLTESLINAKVLNIIENTETIEPWNYKTLEKNLTENHISKLAPTKNMAETMRINYDDINYKKPFNIKGNIFHIIGAIIALCLVLFFGANLFTNFFNSRAFNKAEFLLKNGKYEQALKTFENIPKKGNIEKIENAIDSTKKLIESEKSFQIGKKLITEKKYIGALKNFKKVTAEDTKNYSQAEDFILEIENTLISRAENLIKEKNTDDALIIINNLLYYMPESVSALKLKNSIEENTSLNLDSNQKEEYEKDFESNDRSEMTEKAKTLLHSYQKVVSQKANLREKPDTSSKVITILSQGSDLYIKDTKIEGSERIWAEVEAKDKETGKIYTGWISNKVMQQAQESKKANYY